MTSVSSTTPSPSPEIDLKGLPPDIIENIYGKVCDINKNIIARGPLDSNRYKTNFELNKLYKKVYNYAKNNLHEIKISFDSYHTMRGKAHPAFITNLCLITIFLPGDSVFMESNYDYHLDLKDTNFGMDFSKFLQFVRNVAEHTYPLNIYEYNKIKEYNICVTTVVKKSIGEFWCRYPLEAEEDIDNILSEELKLDVHNLTKMIAEPLKNQYILNDEMHNFTLCERRIPSKGGAQLARLYKKYMAQK